MTCNASNNLHNVASTDLWCPLNLQDIWDVLRFRGQSQKDIALRRQTEQQHHHRFTCSIRWSMSQVFVTNHCSSAAGTGASTFLKFLSIIGLWTGESKQSRQGKARSPHPLSQGNISGRHHSCGIPHVQEAQAIRRCDRVFASQPL